MGSWIDNMIEKSNPWYGLVTLPHPRICFSGLRWKNIDAAETVAIKFRVRYRISNFDNSLCSLQIMLLSFMSIKQEEKVTANYTHSANREIRFR